MQLKTTKQIRVYNTTRFERFKVLIDKLIKKILDVIYINDG